MEVVLPPALAERIATIAADTRSGAAELTRSAREVLSAAATTGSTLDTSAALCRAQPAMAPIWNAAIAALASRGDPQRWATAQLRWERAPAALERFAVQALGGEGRLHVATCSFSGTVIRTVLRLAEQRPVRVSCSEGRPALEGRQLAELLANGGISVDFFTDAALSTAVDEADLLLVGADAVGATAWINKVGTRLLAAAAHHRGLPVHVLATSDKLVMPALWPHLASAEASSGEVWASPPAGVRVRNPYFEATPIELATTVISDLGVLGIDMVADACAALETPAARKALAELLRAL
jgi:translation initiation factor 2B subunit (eIF-2B alpha/beta/delta family)